MIFGRKPREPKPVVEEQEPESEEENAELDSDDTDGVPTDQDVDVDREWRERAAAVIPGGASTGSKRAAALYGEENDFGPTHFARAQGCVLTTPGGEELVDCTMALGSVAIGYGDKVVAHSVADAAMKGNVAGLSHVLEVHVAERLCDVIPCAEQVRFLKTGAEAVAASVRIARTYTGRDRMIGSGYFGWLDWSSQSVGVPDGVKRDFQSVPFDDVGALERAAADAGDRLAAIILEPVVERLPSPEWARAARKLCDDRGAVLIFDEIKTGFRLRTGGYQEYAGIEPDLAAFGKAMANGFPLSAVVGRAAVMEAAEKTWISSTLAGEATALAAASAVLDWHERAEVCEALWTVGAEMRGAVERALEASGIEGVTVEGIDPMWLLRWDTPARETRFLQIALDEGVLFKRGAYNFSSLAHEADAIAAIEHAASTAMVMLRDEES
jgi:glutamate-1-semialdehyde 2,1-aminomutase